MFYVNDDPDDLTGWQKVSDIAEAVKNLGMDNIKSVQFDQEVDDVT